MRAMINRIILLVDWELELFLMRRSMATLNVKPWPMACDPNEHTRTDNEHPETPPRLAARAALLGTATIALDCTE